MAASVSTAGAATLTQVPSIAANAVPKSASLAVLSGGVTLLTGRRRTQA